MQNKQETANTFCSHLSKVFVQPYNDIGDNILDKHNENTLSFALPLYHTPKPFSPSEIQYCIITFLLQKSPGTDLITTEVACHLPKKALIHLTHILNSILRLSYFPFQWNVKPPYIHFHFAQ